jgi:hypothetical protein
MTSFTAGITVGDREFCIFDMSPASEMTLIHAAEVGEVMTELCTKVNEDPDKLWEVFPMHEQLFKKHSPKFYVELERPVHVGVGYIVHAIRMAGVKVTTYYRLK